MAYTAVGAPNILVDPGVLFWAPASTALPTHTAAGSKFSDTWPTGWLGVGATEDGSTFSYETNVEAINVAELLDPVKYATTARSGNIAFNLADYTLTNLKRALNGGTITTTGTAATSVNAYTLPNPGQEARAMIGWESQDSTVRLIAYQCLNSGTVASAFKKAPAIAVIPCQFNFEIPSGSTQPFGIWTAGTARA